MNIKQILFVLGCFFNQSVFAEDVELLLAPPPNVLIKGTVIIEAEVLPRLTSIPITIFIDGRKYCWDVGKVSCLWNTHKELTGTYTITAIANTEDKVLTKISTVTVYSDKASASIFKRSIGFVTIQ
jgi:hypothetical protein